jgi:osmotically-inducible protein OsmY
MRTLRRKRSVEPLDETDEVQPDLVEQAARERVTVDCPCAFYFRGISIHHDDGLLTLRGQLPTFYLKQTLQSRLLDVEGVKRIDNQVDVVSSAGVSNIRHKRPK